MDKKTMESLRAMLCEEINDIAKKGNLGTHETLDILKDLIETEKNLGKIEHYDNEKEMKEGLVPYDAGYSQRKYYIDADYQPQGMNSYARGRMGRGSYGMEGRMVYDVDTGNSYVYYDPRYEQGWSMAMDGGNSNARGYSRLENKAEITKELQKLMNETKDESTKATIQKILSEMNK